MNSTFLGFYSIGSFYLSHLGDKYNKNRLIFIMYSLIGCVQFYLGFLGHSTEFGRKTWPFYLVKILDGTFQSFAWAVNFAIICNWFPRKGRGFLLGLWGTNPSVGDIFGQQLFRALSGNDVEKWNSVFYVLGIIVFCIGLMNLLVLREYPIQCNL
jgi:sugar phosphate permease